MVVCMFAREMFVFIPRHEWGFHILRAPFMCRSRSVPSRGITGRTVTMYVSDDDGDEFQEACLPGNLEDDG
jgi:hypothetical protein